MTEGLTISRYDWSHSLIGFYSGHQHQIDDAVENVASAAFPQDPSRQFMLKQEALKIVLNIEQTPWTVDPMYKDQIVDYIAGRSLAKALSVSFDEYFEELGDA